MNDIVGGDVAAGKSTHPKGSAGSVVTAARARAQAVYEFELMHDSPDRWESWEREEFERFVSLRAAALLASDRAARSASWHRFSQDSRFLTRHPEPTRWVDSHAVLDLGPTAERAWMSAHEAGHAVVALLVGIEIAEVWLVAEPGSERGHGSAGGGMRMGRYHVDWSVFAAMLAAGERAGERWMHQRGVWTPERAWANEITSRSDRVLAVESGRSAGLPAPVSFGDGGAYDYARALEIADHLLAEHWEQVMAVASELFRVGRLSGAQVAELAGLTMPAPVLPDGGAS